MEKVFLFILAIFLAYYTAFYTTRKKKGYTKLFDLDAIYKKIIPKGLSKNKFETHFSKRFYAN